MTTLTAARTESPESLDAAAALLQEASRLKATVGFIGGGTDLELGHVPKPVDLVVRTEKLAHVVEYAPSDMVISVEAGMPVGELQRVVGEHRQRLAFDPPLVDRATIGGALAANQSGPLRARYGTLRDLIVGVSFVRADGTLARGGGKVVKNVAGFDLPKLMVGSLGTLGMIATATFRLHPEPEVKRWFRLDGCDATQGLAVWSAIVRKQLEPAAIVRLRDGSGSALAVLFEGFGRGVDEQSERFAALAQALGSPAAQLDAAAVAQFGTRHDEARTSGAVRIKLAALPTQLVDHEERLNAVALALRGERIVTYPSVGVAYISGEIADLAALVIALEHARSQVEIAGGSLVLVAAPAELRERLDVFGRAPAALALMRAIKDRFDPEHRLNPGRFIGGI